MANLGRMTTYSFDLSFITVNYRTPELVNNLISSIIKNVVDISYEIIVVDNASNDNSTDIIKNSNPGVKFLALPQNIGFGAGNNKGVEMASGKILVLVNSDCEFVDNRIGSALKYLEESPDIGILGLKVISPSGEIEQSARGFPDASTGLFGRSTVLGRISQKLGIGRKISTARRNLQVDPSKTEPYDVDWVAGTIMIIRRDCWDAVQGFDEGYFMYWEDADFCYRAKKAGFRTAYYPGATVLHRPGSSASLDPIPAIRYFHSSAYRYVVKHLSPGWSFLRAFAWLALNLRALILSMKARIKK